MGQGDDFHHPVEGKCLILCQQRMSTPDKRANRTSRFLCRNLEALTPINMVILGQWAQRIETRNARTLLKQPLVFKHAVRRLKS
jgi:hypothetical protein